MPPLTAKTSQLPPNKRPVNMVFELRCVSHMKVMDNVGDGLKMDGVDGGEIRRRVDEALSWLNQGGLRTPDQLYGQRQRAWFWRARW